MEGGCVCECECWFVLYSFCHTEHWLGGRWWTSCLMLVPHVQAVGIDPGSLCCEIDPLTLFLLMCLFFLHSVHPFISPSVACATTPGFLSFNCLVFFSLTPFSPLPNRRSVNIARLSRPHAWEPVCDTNDELSMNASLHLPHLSPSPFLSFISTGIDVTSLQSS